MIRDEEQVFPTLTCRHAEEGPRISIRGFPRLLTTTTIFKEKDMTKLITIGNQELIRVGRDYPWPICGKPDWCLVFADQSKAVCA